jgi:hypothetical protein
MKECGIRKCAAGGDLAHESIRRRHGTGAMGQESVIVDVLVVGRLSVVVMALDMGRQRVIAVRAAIVVLVRVDLAPRRARRNDQRGQNDCQPVTAMRTATIHGQSVPQDSLGGATERPARSATWRR